MPSDRPVYVICRSGQRSKAGAQELTDAGYPACSVAGGTLGWIAAGRPTVTWMEPGA